MLAAARVPVQPEVDVAGDVVEALVVAEGQLGPVAGGLAELAAGARDGDLDLGVAEGDVVEALKETC